LTNALDIANHGVQALNQLNLLRPETKLNVGNLLKKFTEMGGDASRYKIMSEALKPAEENK
jgi:hypothetical protein